MERIPPSTALRNEENTFRTGKRLAESFPVARRSAQLTRTVYGSDIVPMPTLPSLAEIEAATELIRSRIPHTPVYRWPLLEEIAGCEVWVKHENTTPVGAFKIRGGLVYLDELKRHEPHISGVIAATTGNHGQSIAYASRVHDLRAVIVVPEGNNPEKNAAMRALGAEVIEYGREFQESLEYSREFALREGLHAVPSFHPWLVRGVATYALEFFRSVPPLDGVFVPIGLGSGFCGLAAVKAALGLSTELIGVVSAAAPAYSLSFRERRLIEQPSQTRIAEGVACKTPHPDALALICEHAARIEQIDDDSDLEAIADFLRCTHHLVEGAGALAWAALKAQRERWAGKRVGIILSGGNASTALIRQVAESL